MRTVAVTSTPAPNARSETTPRGRSVLVVESDPDQQWRIARMLTVSGHRVVGTSSGDGALALIAEWPVDLVIIDDVGGTDAASVAARIRERHPGISVALMLDAEAAPIDPSLFRIDKPLRGEDVERVVAASRAGKA